MTSRPQKPQSPENPQICPEIPSLWITSLDYFRPGRGRGDYPTQAPFVNATMLSAISGPMTSA